MSGRIRTVWGTRDVPLLHPYRLSFSSLTDYHSVWVCARDAAGGIGLGEAVALPGYGWETDKSVASAVAEVLGDGDFEDVGRLVARCRDIRSLHPFAASAIMTALELPKAMLNQARPAIPINAPLSGEEGVEALRARVDVQLAAGFTYLKIKIGQNLDTNIAAAHALLTEWPGQPFHVLFDANQGFSLDDAMRFAKSVEAMPLARFLWLEQPVQRDDWEGMATICRAAKIPILLDECIYDERDIFRAAKIGAAGVKLKIFKNFGMSETMRLARLARSLGCFVVFGNGVATDIGNLAEYFVLAAGGSLFSAPAECNGFHKLRVPMLGSLLSIDAYGRMICTAGPAKVQAAIRSFGDAVLAGPSIAPTIF